MFSTDDSLRKSQATKAKVQKVNKIESERGKEKMSKSTTQKNLNPS